MRFPVQLRQLLAAAVLILAPTMLGAQNAAAPVVAGTVVDKSGAPLASVQVVATNEQTGAQQGAITGSDGRYSIPGLRAGAPYRIEARMIGFGTETVEGVRLASGASRTIDFALGGVAVSVDAIEVLASRAVERKTPVAYSDVPKAQVQRQLASRDMPLVLNTKPSVYATAQGGGAGDARVNVRGFNQRNVAVMINGVPVNDMENGWVYWSNWDGVGDATSSIQLQRGLSAVNLATPSIGGTLNVITDPAAMGRSAMVKQEFGNDGFRKTTVMGSTGLLDDRFAFMAAGVRKEGDGVILGTWTDAWAYYLAGSYQVNDRNRVELFALGAPQRHGQNLYRQNIGAYSHEFARGLDGYDPAALEKFKEGGFGWNQTVSPVSTSYNGVQAVGGRTFNRYLRGYINERENFYHKPQVNLNWYSELSPRLGLSTVAYYSGGEGGGTGTYGRPEWDFSGPSRRVNYDATIAVNQGAVDAKGKAKAPGQSLGILRNSRNNQATIGAISKLKYELSQPVTVEVGVDWRTAEIEHYYEVRDLLGGEFYVDNKSEFWTAEQQRRRLGDRINYDFTNTVDWAGAYLQSEYDQGPLSAYGMAGLSTIKYGYTNHFKKAPGTDRELSVETDNINGYQVKGGGLYNLTEQLGMFVNAGYVSKVPIFDGVIDDRAGMLNRSPANEKFLSFEAGANFRSAGGKLSARSNLYRTAWLDRTFNRTVVGEDGVEGMFSFDGVDALHQGIEFEVAYRPIELIRFDAAASFGDWTYTNDVSGTYRPDDRNADVEEYNFYVKDLRVGDAPQTQLAYAATVFPMNGLYVEVVGKTFMRHYADFDPFSRTNPLYPSEVDSRGRAGDRGVQSWRAPDYTVFDLHTGYELPGTRFGTRMKVFANVFNVLDEIYIQDALDNSRFNGFDFDHDADDAEVYFGLPRTFTLGIQFTH